MIAALGIGSAYAIQAVGFVFMLGVTVALPRLDPAPTDTEHPPILRVDQRGPDVRARQQRADGLVRDRPGGDDVRDAARAVRRARAHRLRRGRERHRPALRLRLGGRDGRGAHHRLGRARPLARADRDRRGRWSGAWRSRPPASCRRSGPPRRCWRSPARRTASAPSAARSSTRRSRRRSCAGRMSAIFMLVVTSGPRLGDLESGIAASLTTAGVAVVSGGFACVAGVGADRRCCSPRWRPTTAASPSPPRRARR